MPFLDEMGARLASSSVGVVGSNIFLGSKAVIPTGSGPYLSLIETGGMEPTRTQNQDSAATQRPTAQVLVRAASYQVARTMAKAAYVALDGIFNTTLSGTFYLYVKARQEPTDIGLDNDTRAQLVFNIEAEKQFS